MKHGCMVKTLRLSSNCRNASCQIHRGRKKHVKFAAMLSPFRSFSPTSKALSTRNLYPLVKLSMANFTVRFWSGSGRAFGANVQTSGRTTIGFSTMTKRPLTHHSLFDNSWLPKTLKWSPHSPDLAPCDFFLLTNVKLRLKGRLLTRMRSSMQNHKRLSTHPHLKTPRDAWNHGKHAGITVNMPKGTTSKETV